MRKMTISIMALVLLLSLASVAAADMIVPYADEYFNSLTINLTSRKYVAYQATAKHIHSVIKVTECTLQKKNGTKWEDDCELTAPSGIAENTNAYDETMDYSDVIGTGTYRVSATFYADGYTVTRTSNVRTYE